MAGRVTRKKAREILRDGRVRGKKLSSKQKGLFGLIAGGVKPTRTKGKSSGNKRNPRSTRKRARK